MSLRTLYLFICIGIACTVGRAETFDRIVLKDMTVIKASLVKEVGDSLAYFELNDPDFTKHMVGRDQVFKWVRATPQTEAPQTAVPQPATPPSQKVVASDSNHMKQQSPRLESAPAPEIKETAMDTIPVVDYQIVIARIDSIERSKNQPAAIAAPVRNPVTPVIVSQEAASSTASAIILETDPSDAVPENLTKVRLDPPTGTEGVKIMPRSGMFALNINPSISSFGAGLRAWSAAGFGFNAKAAVLWGSASGFLVNGEIMQALNKQGRVRWYGLLSIGYTWETITTPAIDIMSVHIPSTSMDLSFLNYCFGLGAEWRTGINRNHGWALELAYQGGSAEYETEGYTMDYGYGYSYPVPPQKHTVKLSPVYFGLTYAYYF
ncbi:MAG: hypothetical protein A2268_03085 [Candidatus Raymondbacteria bacterium RifOxyA12_full_50_37]|uniref:Outer membrane protein beta-barrel domain-containing protein n=1 Tax=Candidatus Raymondbacteria bacterium RIFOXYD12_FULL_49_13 TaxID=1817890 RepID=A0A1F7F9B2_UNCRA|nr:MAG: hypothetical protein A2248_17195 [Candidatus Raymondbacteria bacterium RIFOXYA2_FULL_49_16]OGJ90761.1 MAG: hypothetical protein A2268_03085 [Candidatus Raymondbacteria bacterium RifOxyA12_full_50_37]OGJ92953.1 MAG: hypothetical protein A2350_04950 [Candidatus Raymondbacteria bacterium RifOxyB12_full_50_8]OGJ98398.1 MAG: hypothetical protein A2453_09095 [Candidatus Raymondbacteria bacterium RIFOXYC2_FULL_50_21]OGK03122.1 MAG: hypothetical protein A2519_06930 [Candidatus Raymondbacteria b